MAFSISGGCSFVSFQTLKPHTVRLQPQLAEGDNGSAAFPSSISVQTSRGSLTAAKCQRRSANYPPSVWEHEYIQSLATDYLDDDAASQYELLKEEVRKLLCNGTELADWLQLVDTLQQLGVAYHFEKEIENILKEMYRLRDDMMAEMRDDLTATSLFFRLMREHGFHVSPDIFNRFMEEDGNFKAHLSFDINGILSLYEASFLAIQGENQMDEARKFATECLRDFEVTYMKNMFMEKMTHALSIPLHWRMERLHTRWFIDHCEKEKKINPLLLQFSKLDFNMVQETHKKELKEMSRWWTNLDLGRSLHFARDRLVENYLVALGCVFEPKHSRSRVAIAKANCFVTMIDDVYDVYGSLEELKLFTNIVIRWETNAVEQLPKYMKVLLTGLFNMVDDVASETLKVKGLNVLPFLKKSWADLCKAYLMEATWFHNGYIPSLREYQDCGVFSSSAHIILAHAYCASEDLTKEDLEHFNIYPEVVCHSSLLLRSYNDLATSKAELYRGDVPKSIECYMHESGATENIARQHISEIIASTWKKLNGDWIANTSSVQSFKLAVVNIPRVSLCIYGNGDGYAESGGETKDQVISLLIEPIPL